MKIGVISDTHIPKKVKTLPQFVLDNIKGVDHIIHAGDVMSTDVLKILEEIAPVTAVAGNVDDAKLLEKLGEKKIITFNKFRIGIFHGHGKTGKTVDRVLKRFKDDEVNCIIFGHSHIPYCQYHEDILLFNPGSPTDKRRNKYFSIGMLTIDDVISPKIIYFNDKGIQVEV